MYAIFVETLVQSICHCLGSDMSEDVHEAWLNLASFALRGMLPEVMKEENLMEDNVMTSGRSKSSANEHSQVVSGGDERSEEHTSELQSLMRSSYAVFCLKKKTQNTNSEDDT